MKDKPKKPRPSGVTVTRTRSGGFRMKAGLRSTKPEQPSEDKTKAQREGALMSELCQQHGYTFSANKPGDRVSVMFDRSTERVGPMYTMRLAVPMDSALGKQMLAQYPLKKKT